MIVDDIRIKRAATEARFNEVQAEQNKAKEQVKATDEELFRLQGEYRVYTTMLEEVGAAVPVEDGFVPEPQLGEPGNPETDPALTITAKPKQEATNGSKKETSDATVK